MKFINKTAAFLAVAAMAFSALTSAGITPVGAAESAVSSVEEQAVECYNPSSALALSPTVIARIDSSSDLIALKKEERAAVALMSLNADGYILKADGAPLNFKPSDIYNDYLKGRVIPALQISELSVAESVSQYIKQSFNLVDMEIVSSSGEVLEYFKQNNPKIRRILDFSKSGLPQGGTDEAVFESNILGAHAVILSAEDSTQENVRAMQALNKPVWTAAGGELETYEAIACGAYGIVTDNASEVYSAFSKAAQSGFLLNRAPFNVAHRGLASTNYENSIEAFEAAYEAGATHVELDVQLTKDNVPVIMHAENLNAVTTGSGKVSDYTLEELKQFKIIKNCKNQVLGEGVPIPTLEEVFARFKNDDLLFLVEIKAGSAGFSEIFKGVVEKCGVKNKIVIISFNEAQLKLVRKALPEVSACSLNDLTVSNFFDKLPLMAEYEYSYDVTYGNAAGGKLYRAMKDRGYMVWSWTYGTYSDLVSGLNSGSTGLTNDAADSIGDFAISLKNSKEYFVVNSFTENGDFTAVCYNGKKFAVKASPVYVEENGDEAKVIYKAKFTFDGGAEYSLLTKAYRCVKKSAYISAEQMNAILGKNAQELTKSEIELLNRMENAYNLLGEAEKESVNFERIASLKKEVEALNNNSGSSSNSGDSGNSGESCSCNSSFGGGALLSLTCVLAFACYTALRRRKN